MLQGKWQSQNWMQVHLPITEALIKQEDTERISVAEDCFECRQTLLTVEELMFEYC